MRRKQPRHGESLRFDFATRTPSDPSIPSAAKVEAKPERTDRFAQQAGEHALSVAELGRMLSRSLDRTFATPIWVEGEVSGARPASSGHVYLSLKDEEEDAMIDVVIYRTHVTSRARTLLEDGARVRVRGRPTFWPPRGRLQFVGDRVEPTGKGTLLEALDQLKAKLKAEGLFDPARKRALPVEPRVIGVVTSAHGAVIHDVCRVAFRRGGARILLASARVQGMGAADEVRRALGMLQRVPEVDVILVARGGGSQEDLLAFYDEALVRDIAASTVPVVSAIGHEVDVTFVDFAADARAATPSQAAEMVVPDFAARRSMLEERTLRLGRAMHARLAEDRAHAARLAKAFGDPRLLIASAQQRVDDYLARLHHAVLGRLSRERDVALRLSARIGAEGPRVRIARDEARLSELCGRLVESTRRRLVAHRGQMAELGGRLDAMSPLKVLGRGYAIAMRTKDRRAIRAASDVALGERVEVRVDRGSFAANVVSVTLPESERGSAS